ncbi:MAG TPA: hypothetical protein P5136_01600 [Methanofastidiosum sp.]|nr:hypothetical protein [Methanofastidiosum sp.]
MRKLTKNQLAMAGLMCAILPGGLILAGCIATHQIIERIKAHKHETRHV